MEMSISSPRCSKVSAMNHSWFFTLRQSTAHLCVDTGKPIISSKLHRPMTWPIQLRIAVFRRIVTELLSQMRSRLLGYLKVKKNEKSAARTPAGQPAMFTAGWNQLPLNEKSRLMNLRRYTYEQNPVCYGVMYRIGGCFAPVFEYHWVRNRRGDRYPRYRADWCLAVDQKSSGCK